MEARTYLAFLQRADRRVVITDSSKIGRVTFARIGAVEEITDVITDRAAPIEPLAALRAVGVRVCSV